VKKTARYLLTLFIIISINFFIPRLMPGDPITNLMGEDYIASQESIDALKAELGLDRPLLVQYASYWGDVIRLDLGHSYHFHAEVAQVIASKLFWTTSLVGLSILFGTFFGAVLGALSGWKTNDAKSKTLTTFFLWVYCTPPFFLSLLVLYVFAFKAGIFPMRGFYETGTFINIVKHFFLPVLVLSLFLTSRNYMIMRGSVIQEKGKLYILYARAKGLLSRGILFRHAFKNASLPLITLIALDIGFIISGALFVEIVFSMNGMGTLIFDALLARDYPVLQGIFLIITVMVVLANYLADTFYGIIDPRVREKR
jgi:peptide/nickel transport system permease protein